MLTHPLLVSTSQRGTCAGLNYVAAGAKAHAQIRQEEAISTLTNFTSLNVLVTLAAIAALFAFYAAAYAPMIRRLDREIKQVRGLLLLFPDSVSRAVPAILNHGREMLQSGTSGGSVVPVSSGSS